MATKFDRLLNDADNIRSQEEQDEARERVRSKIVICLPYDKDSNHYGNCMFHLKEIVRDNEGYSIIECHECSECGAINETVQKTNTGEECGQIAWSDLCGYCAKGLEQ